MCSLSLAMQSPTPPQDCQQEGHSYSRYFFSTLESWAPINLFSLKLKKKKSSIALYSTSPDFLLLLRLMSPPQVLMLQKPGCAGAHSQTPSPPPKKGQAASRAESMVRTSQRGNTSRVKRWMLDPRLPLHWCCPTRAFSEINTTCHLWWFPHCL